MLLIIALLIIFSSLIQLMLMILRVGLLVILTGTLPLAAAASMSDWGETWWRKHVAWLTAWLLYKPAAALLYAAAFALTDGKRTGVEVISGFMMLILVHHDPPGAAEGGRSDDRGPRRGLQRHARPGRGRRGRHRRDPARRNGRDQGHRRRARC